MSNNDRDEAARIRAQIKNLGEQSLSELDRWRWHKLRDDEAEARTHRRQAEPDAVSQLRAEMQRELGALLEELHALHEAALVSVGEALGDFSDKALSLTDKMVGEVRSMLTTEIARKHGELMGRIDAMLPDHRSRPRGFEISKISVRTDAHW